MRDLSTQDFQYAFPISFFETVAERKISHEDYQYLINLMWSAYEDGSALTPWEALDQIYDLHIYKSFFD